LGVIYLPQVWRLIKPAFEAAGGGPLKITERQLCARALLAPEEREPRRQAMNTLRDATHLLKRIVDENPEMPASELWNLFEGQAREEMVDAIMEKSITMIVEVMKEARVLH
jgi:hypothetical protein